jgi:hypothetical protein
MIFLLLTFTGLITMFFKIYSKKTLFYLIKVNSLAAFIVMILIGSFNWDEEIAKFNVQNPNRDSIDVSYLFSLSDAVLPVLNENRDILNCDIIVKEDFRSYMMNGLTLFKSRKNEFLDDMKRYTWLSWNYSDMKVSEYFERNGEKQVVNIK